MVKLLPAMVLVAPLLRLIVELELTAAAFTSSAPPSVSVSVARTPAPKVANSLV
jgi:hypothetical protein